MCRARLALVLSALAAACSSSAPEPKLAEPAQLVVSGSCRREEDTLVLAVAIANQGRGPAAPAAARVELDGAPASGVVRQTRFIAAHAVDSFEVEVPAVCSKTACRWRVTLASAHETGHC
jgi:hypothetical protein